MQQLKLFIDGKQVDQLPVSFEGMITQEERAEHISGLVEYLKSRNVLVKKKKFVIFLDRVPSKVNTLVAEILPVLKKKRIFEPPIIEEVKQPFVRPKAEYSNIRLYDLV